MHPTPATVLAHVRELGIPAYGDDEVLFMADTALKLTPDDVFDWGTNVGASARIFWEITQMVGFGRVHSVDLPADVEHIEHPGHRYAQLLDGCDVDLHRGDGATISAELVRRLRPYRPLFFVDGDHQADNVKRELETIYAAAPLAVCLIHDTRAHAGEGVNAFLADRAQSPHGYRFDVDSLFSQTGMTRLWPR